MGLVGVWIAFAGLVSGFVVYAVLFSFFLGKEVQRNASHRENLKEKLAEDRTAVAEKIAAVNERIDREASSDERSDRGILEAIERVERKTVAATDKIERENREGTAYLGGCLANMALAMNDHESRLRNVEKMSSIGGGGGAGGAGGSRTTSRPRMPQIRPNPEPPEWLPVQAHVPSVDVTTTGRHPVYDPTKGGGR